LSSTRATLKPMDPGGAVARAPNKDASPTVREGSDPESEECGALPDGRASAPLCSLTSGNTILGGLQKWETEKPQTGMSVLR
jgi:hypothetical protein